MDSKWVDVKSQEQQKWLFNYVSTKLNTGNPLAVFKDLNTARDGIHFKLRELCESGKLSESVYKPLCVMRNAWNMKVRRDIEKKSGLKTISLEVSKANFDKLTRLANQSGISKKQLMNGLISGTFQQWEKGEFEIKKIKEERKGRAEINKRLDLKLSNIIAELNGDILTKDSKIAELEKLLGDMTSQIKVLQERLESSSLTLVKPIGDCSSEV
ncbi:MAG: hypothetical protein V7733_11275 [Paraglaciecola polaris]|uniref:hypothetical protein n=1 Tax=Paraglaciecola polaris TaxID=222814 RepID=UPI003002FA0D|tara:strand:+ start:1425 stop:2063 length:639 start_codon:yes stop_codon:yes gene_type:complete